MTRQWKQRKEAWRLTMNGRLRLGMAAAFLGAASAAATAANIAVPAGERYVSQVRLQNMLDYEFKLLIERLNDKRGKTTSFFVFADTVSARNYLGTNECHGWLGIKFQLQPMAEPSEDELPPEKRPLP